MPIVKMDRLTVVGLEKDKDGIIEALTNLGAVEIIGRQSDAGMAGLTAGDGDSELSALQHCIARLDKAIALSRKLNPEKKAMFSGKRKVTESEFSAAVARESDTLEIVTRIERNLAEISELMSRRHRLLAAQMMLEPWQDLDLDLAEEGTENVRLFLYSADTPEQIAQLVAGLQEDAPESHVRIATQDDTGLRCVIAAWRPRSSVVLGHLRRLNFNPLPLQGEKGTPRRLIEQNGCLLDAIGIEIEKKQAENVELTRSAADFEILHDALSIRFERLRAVATLSGTDSTFWLDGWIPSNLVAAVTKGLKQRYLVATDHRPAASDEEYPILFKNSKLVKPYEVIVEMYGPPSSREVDPTPVLAPFFFLFFGIMLSDVGYGLVLTALAYWLTYKVKAGGELGKMARMLLFSGISATIWGFIFGGFFGDIVSVLSNQTVNIPAIWFNPMSDPMLLLVVSVALGVIHLFAGLGVRAYMLFQTGRGIDAVLDIFPIYLMIIGLGLMMAVNNTIGMILTLTSLTVMILFGGRAAKNPVMRIINGFMSIYTNITGYFGDILSYTRVLALVMATSVIAMVFNLLGFIGGPTFGGILLFIPVALIGHTLNLALSALSAYVHTSRLQYVEFFSKFYEGSGRIWRPLDRKTRYIEIGPEEAGTKYPAKSSSLTQTKNQED